MTITNVHANGFGISDGQSFYVCHSCHAQVPAVSIQAAKGRTRYTCSDCQTGDYNAAQPLSSGSRAIAGMAAICGIALLICWVAGWLH
jgi:hypothetical protein